MMETGFCLGSNLGNRASLLRQAKTRILLDPLVRFVDQSPIYETEPVDVRDVYQSMRFLNAVLIVKSPFTAEEWLPRVKAIEQVLGRVRTADRNAPRTIDIDVLYCGGQVIDSDLLQIPHPRWMDRRFVVEPLADVRSQLRLPGCGMAVADVLRQMGDRDSVRRIEQVW